MKIFYSEINSLHGTKNYWCVCVCDSWTDVASYHVYIAPINAVQ